MNSSSAGICGVAPASNSWKKHCSPSISLRI